MNWVRLKERKLWTFSNHVCNDKKKIIGSPWNIGTGILYVIRTERTKPIKQKPIFTKKKKNYSIWLVIINLGQVLYSSLRS